MFLFYSIWSSIVRSKHFCFHKKIQFCFHRTECRQRLGKCSRKIYLSKKKQTERVPSVSSTHREQSTNTENSSKFDFSDPAFLARIANELAYPKTGGVAPKLHISLPNINIISTPEVVLRVDHEGGHISSEQHQTGSDAIQSELSLVEMDEGGRVNRNFLHVEKQQKDEEIYLSHSHPSREFFLWLLKINYKISGGDTNKQQIYLKGGPKVHSCRRTEKHEGVSQTV